MESFIDNKELERLSSAYTLSDMEIFIFPELFYPLVLANIMSPIIWEWRDDPWFKDIEKKNFTYKINRIKQYVIDHFVFNLDLDTWGLTTKDREIERFKDFFDIDHLKQSNALFGYEGDKYYYDIDIRKHFGLDQYTTDVIPYWKTETIEAMRAFRYKEGFTTGAGECVSLSALYAAAMFIIGRIPLDDIFLVATPLHSQNFIAENDGVITNNRRIVTKNMWFNGTSLSAKARRALENEKVTIVSHISGYIHTLLADATIDKKEYERFDSSLRKYLVTEPSVPIFINYLRFKSKYKKLFQFEYDCSGMKKFISLEKLFEYEHNSKYQVTPETRSQLINEIDGDEFHISPIQNKISLNLAEAIIKQNKIQSLDSIKEKFYDIRGDISKETIDEMIEGFHHFIYTEPKLPSIDEKNFIQGNDLEISVSDTRNEIFDKIKSAVNTSEMAKLTIYVYRQMDKTYWTPYVKAAIERNPVCYNETNGKYSIEDLYHIVSSLTNESIYDGARLALPDEVWNFKRGDGIEKAFLLANIIHYTDKSSEIDIKITPLGVCVKNKGMDFFFETNKQFTKEITITERDYIVR